MEGDTENQLEVAVDSIRVHMATGQHVVILKEKGAERYLPIWIGNFEANAIALKITGVAVERPVTHDLINHVFAELGIQLNRIVVTALADEVFYASLQVVHMGREVDIDSRPSDAIALAVRFECPIFVATAVLEEAGVTPDPDDTAAGDGRSGDDDRLDVFRNLVNSLDLPDLPDDPGRTSI